MRRRAGFTLIELMVSMGILLLLAGYLTQMLVNQSRAYAVVDRVTETQQNVRTVSSLLEREIRSAGMLTAGSASVCGVDRTDGSDVLFVTDGGAIDDPEDRRDFLGIPVTGGYTGDGSSEDVSLASSVLDTPSYDTNDDGNPDADFLATTGAGPNRQGGVIIVDRNNPERGASCGVVTSVTPGSPPTSSGEIEVDFEVVSGGDGSALEAYDSTTMEPADVVAVPAHVYRVQDGQLLRDGLVLADDVEDLQVVYFFDTDGDLEEEAPAETPGASGASEYEAPSWNHAALREVRVSLVARTRSEDPTVAQGAGTARGTFQTTANRADPGDPADGFRRRVHSITVRPRNVGRRPPVGG